MSGEIPAKVGDYRLISKLGSGGMGYVYFGVSPTADRVAVKVIKPQLVSGPTMRERFAEEVKSLKLVYGSRVARLEDADPMGDPAWLAVEYVPGRTLKQHVEARGPLPARLGAMVGAMLADGLAKVHQAGLLHRDLKPQNIILGPDGPKLIDFGLAVLNDRDTQLTETGALVGTPAYMSPEQVNAAKDLTSAVDIYGLAATLVFAFTGHGLYSGPTAWAILNQISKPDQLPDLTDIPTELEPLLGVMLAFDPAARPSLHTVRSRLLEVATSGGQPAEETRKQVAELTFDDSAELAVPAHLTDPVKDPEDGKTDDGTGIPPEPTIEPAADPPSPDPVVKPQVDVGWLVERLRRQYARRATLQEGTT